MKRRRDLQAEQPVLKPPTDADDVLGVANDGRASDQDHLPYRSVYTQLRRQITTGRLKPGDRLPSNRELEAQFGHANMTVRKAVDVLRAEGLVHTLIGVGSFVGSRPSAPPRPTHQGPARRTAGARLADAGLSQQIALLTERVHALEQALWGHHRAALNATSAGAAAAAGVEEEA
ncbi:winged helix-turn-helix domain-containing protein [Streptomyces lydicus]|uniref:winged helix-turn-helix domain-containing protein n=1 Tax=Streptomyces lydicus TaxID=47763 RepID=UPI0033F53C2F